uniref:recombinase family protein n=1 Tax=Nocardia noduli TaxID=2815722 RepID=UPI001C23E1B2
GYHRIADRLNTHPTRYPAPTGGAWAISTITHILRNPKYTGYQVYNRTRMKTAHHRSKTNPPEQWIWSAQPVHPAIITIEQFTYAQTIAPTTERSRHDPYPGAPNTSPRAKTTYKLRSYITCAHCGYRFCGRTDGPRIYYICQPPKHKLPQHHPTTITLPENQILTAISDSFNALILGTAHRRNLHALLHTSDGNDRHGHHDETQTLQNELTSIDARRDRLIRNLSLFDPDLDRTTVDDIQQHLRALDAQHRATTSKLEALPQFETQTDTIAAILDRLPYIDVDLTELPTAPLRQLLNAYRFTATYDHREHHARLSFDIGHPVPNHQEDQ